MEPLTNIDSKSRDLLAKALMSDELIKDDILKIAKMAADIEKFIFQEFKRTDIKYRNRVRSRISNLSDENNLKLREQVLNGTISAEELAKMSAQELASDRMKGLRNRLIKETFL